MTNKKMEVDETCEQIKSLVCKKADLTSALAKKIFQYNDDELLAEIDSRNHLLYLDVNSIIECSDRMNKIIDNMFELSEGQLDRFKEGYLTVIKLQLSSIEEKLVDAIHYHNYAVELHNKYISLFPNNIATSIIGARELIPLKAYFEVKGLNKFD